jgi:hypothetical protein
MFTWVNQGNATTRVNNNQSITLRDPGGSVSLDTHHLLFTLPAAPYKIDVELEPTFGNLLGKPKYGVAWRQSSDGSLVLYGMESQGGAQSTEISGPTGNFHQLVMFARKLDGPDTLNSEYQSHRMGQVPRFWRLEDDETDRICYWSMTGHPDDWIEYHRVANDDFIEADGVTIWIDTSEAQATAVVICCVKAYNYMMAETNYEYETVAQTPYTTPRIYAPATDKGYEYETEAKFYLYAPLPPTLTSNGPTTTRTLTTTGSGPPYNPYQSPPFIFNTTNVYLNLVAQNPYWLLQVKRVSDDALLAQYRIPYTGFNPNDTPVVMTKQYGSGAYPPTLTVSVPSAPTAKSNNATSLTIPNVTANVGDLLVVAMCGVPAWDGATWGTVSVDYAFGGSYGAGNGTTVPRVDFLVLEVLASGTHDIIIGFTAGGPKTAILKIVEGRTVTRTQDNANGTSDSPADVAQTPAAYPVTALVAVGTFEQDDGPDGTWGDGFTEIATIGTDAGSGDVRVSFSFKEVASGSFTPSKTITVSQVWNIIDVSFSA